MPTHRSCVGLFRFVSRATTSRTLLRIQSVHTVRTKTSMHLRTSNVTSEPVNGRHCGDWVTTVVLKPTVARQRGPADDVAGIRVSASFSATRATARPAQSSALRFPESPIDDQSARRAYCDSANVDRHRTGFVTGHVACPDAVFGQK